MLNKLLGFDICVLSVFICGCIFVFEMTSRVSSSPGGVFYSGPSRSRKSLTRAGRER
jgi:hypothetical protein